MTAAFARVTNSLDAGLLGMGSRRRRLLLDPGDLGAGAASRFVVDAALVGLGRRHVLLPRRATIKDRSCRLLYGGIA